jgi:threonine dehydrogenase-like Zn-dependent dehydrogenase
MRAIYFDVSVPRVLATQALSKVWRGAYFGPTAPVRCAEVEAGRLEAGWLRVDNRVCGICASDLHLVFVDVDPRVHPAALPGGPRIYLGHETVGAVAEVGAGVGLEVGTRVLMRSRFLGPHCRSQGIEPLCGPCADGNYALCVNQGERRGPIGVGGGWGDAFTCHESEVWPVPDDLDDDQGALVEPLACSVRAVVRRPPRAGERALVLGCGIIGLGVVQAALALGDEGCEVYGAARYPQQVAAVESYGARVVRGDLFEQTAAITGAHLYRGPFGNRTLMGGFDVVYDCVASAATIEQSLRMVRAGGTVVLVGVNLNRVKLDLSPVLLQEVDLIGALAHGMERWEGERISTFDLTARLIREHKVVTDGLITHRFGLDDWREAIRTSVDKRSGAIKVVFDY